MSNYRWGKIARTRDASIAYLKFFEKIEAPYDVFTEDKIIKCAHDLGYSIESFSCQNLSHKRIDSILLSRGIVAVILSRTNSPIPLPDLSWEHFSVVGLTHYRDAWPINTVGPNSNLAIHTCWQQIKKRGYKRIGAALLHPDESSNTIELVGSYLFYERKYIPPDLRIPVFLDGYFAEAKANFFLWMQTYKPQVVIGGSDLVYWWLVEGGWRVPQDVAFCSVSINERHQLATISGCVSHINDEGTLAVQLLDRQIRHEERGIPKNCINHLVTPSWWDGQTLP